MKNLLDAQSKAAALATYRAPPVRPAFERIGIYPVGGAFFFDDNSATWRIVYERGHLPTPGAMAYSYMSQAQGMQSVCGPGFDIQGPGWKAFQPRQAYQPQTVGIQGAGLFAGQVATAPLDQGNVNGKTGV